MTAYSECEHLVQYYETDQMGVAHHSNYIRWFEEVRTVLFEELGLGYKGMEEGGIISPVVAVSARYKTMAKYCDTVIIRAEVTKYTGVRFNLKYEIYDKATKEIRCEGTSEHCFISPEGKILSLKRSYPEIHERFDAIVNGKEE
ncbi:MAG: acyl-CoA thioesterase [Saccharofermentans sp.]|jgi:acyl-CoA thioester hydrolase|nr:acyl-CoA thioesterase [Saccharofermentans sp.]